MPITVLGGTGMIGSRIADQLEQRGHQVTRSSRQSGVDALDAPSLESAFTGDEIVVDCLNIETLAAKKSRDFFGRTARNVVGAAHSTGIRRIVCVSIAGATNPQVNRFMGYYQGKALQEEIYRTSPVPTTVIHSTQWFELMESIARRAVVGPIAVLPTMKMMPVAAYRAAEIIARHIDHVGDGTKSQVLALRGPEETTTLQLCRQILAAKGTIDGRSPRIMMQVPFLGRAIATGGLIPNDAVTDDLTLEQWLTAAAR